MVEALSRRRLLKSGLVGLGVIGLASAGLVLQRTKTIPLPKDGLLTFTPEQYAIFSAVAQRCCPPASREPGKPAVRGAGPDDLDVALMADRLLAYADDDMKAGMQLALTVIESNVAGALFFERTAPFTQLSPEDQDRVLYAFSTSKVGLRRTVFRALSGFSGSLYYGDPSVWPSVGYPGPPSPAGLRAAYAHQLVDLHALRKKPV